MSIVKLTGDRAIVSTDTNEYAEGINDETLWEEQLVDTEIPASEFIPDGVNETEGIDRPLYNEAGYKYR